MAVRGFSILNSRPISFGAGGQSGGTFGKAALTLTVSATALVLAVPAFAQETQLPGINVQGAQAKKSSAPKAKPKPKPVQAVQSEPAAPAEADGGNQAAAASDAPYNTPASVSVAGQSEIQTFGQADIQDVFRAMPGVSTGNDPNNPGISVNIRGFEGQGRVNTMIDGVRQNFRITGHTVGGFAYVDPLLLASIEVQRGAVSGVGGSGALAGSANLRTLDVDDVLKPGKDYGALTSLTWGSNGLGFSEMGAGAIRSGAISIVGAISKHDQDDYENGRGQRVPYTDQDLISGLAKAHIRIDSAQQVSFGTILYNNDFTANSYNQNIDSKIYTASYVYNPAANDLINFRANFSGSDLNMRYLGGIGNSATSAGRNIEDLGLGFDVSNTSLFNLGGIAVKSTYGYEYFHDDVDATNTIDPSKGGGTNPSGKSTTRGAFSETTFSKNIFDLIVGLRYDDFNLNGHGVVDPHAPSFLGPNFPIPLPPGIEKGPFSVDNSYGDLSEKFTLAAKPVEWFQPYVTWSNTFRAPSISETLIDGTHPGSGFEPNFYPNPFLQPEKQRGWEFGFNSKVDGLIKPGDSFRFKGDYYTMDVNNYITAACEVYNPTFGLTNCWFVNNPGTSKVEGVELEGTYDAGYFFAGLSYSHSHTTLPSQMDGLGLHSYLPGDVTTITAGLRFFDERLTIGARSYITSKSQKGDVNVEPGDPLFYDGYTTYDLFSNYKVNDDINVALTVTNLTDLPYTPALSSPGTGSGVMDTGRGRTFLLTTRAQF
ncbi:TonB-dependent receptor domain-containing protein [Hyphomicrobium sp. 99]|uniref:TonB-dependent receptor domain-containing protein n=1 Tax=Hyphomicrobium sp. 99 TaxID=1163419 RepID=UPI000695D807|nr:TonB-dependent receptor [Hyphomicrobium sp. 99]